MIHESHQPVVAIILNWRTPELTLQCVRSVQASVGVCVDILIVDNASGDDSVAILDSELGGQVRVVSAFSNLGYGAGMNLGIDTAANAGARYALLLNSDVLLAHDAIHHLVTAATASDGTVYSPTVYWRSFDEPMCVTGLGWSWLYGDRRRIMLANSNTLSDKPVPREDLSGAALLVDLSRLGNERIDPVYGMYYENADLFCRLRRKQAKLYWVPRAKITHSNASSTRKIRGMIDFLVYYRTRNWLLWGRRNVRGFRLLSFWANIFVRIPMRVFRLILRRDKAAAKGALLGVNDFVMGRFGMRPIE
jgi:N-acetylglucosaminyl-diphospho-decaprenol L-rhamnosyltransferase